MCNEVMKCVKCEKKAKFIDSENEPYCSEECYLKAWKIKFFRLDKRIVYDCSYCDETIDHCDECHEDLEQDSIICELDQGKHFCSTECLFKHYNWQTLEEREKDIISQMEGDE